MSNEVYFEHSFSTKSFFMAKIVLLHTSFPCKLKMTWYSDLCTTVYLSKVVCTYVVYHCYILRFTGFWYKWGHKDILSLQCFQKTFLFCRQHSIFMLINLSKYYVPGTYFNHFGRDLKSSRESLRHAEGQFSCKVHLLHSHIY